MKPALSTKPTHLRCLNCGATLELQPCRVDTLIEDVVRWATYHPGEGCVGRLRRERERRERAEKMQ